MILVSIDDLVQFIKACDKHLTRLGAFLRTDDAGSLQLVHKPSGAVVADGIPPLYA